MTGSVTTRDVAELAGVSIATVSRVFNQKSNVSHRTKAAVMHAADTLGYHSTESDDSKQATDKFIVIVPDFTKTAELLTGIELAAVKYGKFAVILSEELCDVTGFALTDAMTMFRGAGILICGDKMPRETIMSLAEYPLIVAGSAVSGVNSVGTDDYAAAEDAVSYLCGAGHKRVGLFTASHKTVGIIHRDEGYRDALHRHGLPYDESLTYIYDETDEYASGARGLAYFETLPNPPTAVFAVSDTVCAGAMSAIKTGTAKEVSLFGFENNRSIAAANFSIVEKCMRDRGYNAASRLFQQITDACTMTKDTMPVRTIIPHSLVIKK
ncbi:catabolite control protein A [Clostridia bacterium]|nr:catabolite control protein A [Clostridia bacterium]